ncbi:protein rep (plasmid) [Streptomyces sp. NBC_01136]|uniref:protein rep n=1 Tax=Streptomyces sp. NBC_01136 TaxID=2903754 RepID=UPI0037DCA32B|nr:protein rep [Streptomyces sp. NBC_01136]
MSKLPRFIDCGRKAIAGGVTLKTGANAAGWEGVATCGSVHVCPVCMPTVRRARAEELGTAGSAWESVDLEHGQARGLVLVTLTMRHYERQSLGLLTQRQREAWKLAFGQNALRTTKAIKKGLGVVGHVRSWETTHGANGWHAHYHVALFLEERPSPRRVRVLQRLIHRAWADALQRVGAYRPSEAHGVRVDAPGVGEAGQIAKYLMKGQDGKTWGAAQEMVRGDVKAGRKGHRMPLQIARGAVDGDADDVELWREYEEAATGLRALYWSQGLRKRLAELMELDNRTDAEVATDAEVKDKKPLAHFPVRTWYGHVVKVPGRRLQLVPAEKWATSGVRTLVESWGLLWGVDVTEPENLPKGADPTAAEVLVRLERADLQARAEVWRKEFARQDLEERLSRTIEPDAWADGFRAVAQAAEDRTNQRARSTAQERQETYRAALREAKATRPAAELQSAMQRFRDAA